MFLLLNKNFEQKSYVNTFVCNEYAYLYISRKINTVAEYYIISG